MYLKQLGRLLGEIGLWRIILIIAATLLASLVLLKKAEENAVGFSVFILALVFFLHVQRKDKPFLKSLHIKDQLLYFIHYQLLASPFYILLFLYQKFALFSLLFISISMVPLIPPISPSFRVARRKFPEIRLHNFEFISGIRQYSFLLLMLYLLAFFFYQVPYVAFGAIIVFTFLSTTFYQEAEPWQMVEVYQLSPAKFLWMKIKNQWLDFWLLSSPFCLLFLLGKPGFWYILLVWVGVCSIIQACSICLKYTFYAPGKDFDNSIFMGVYFISLFVPFFVPVPMVMLVRYFKKAQLNLNPYLYDYH